VAQTIQLQIFQLARCCPQLHDKLESQKYRATHIYSILYLGIATGWTGVCKSNPALPEGIRSLLWAEVQPTLNLSAETVQWSCVLVQGEEGNW